MADELITPICAVPSLLRAAVDNAATWVEVSDPNRRRGQARDGGGGNDGQLVDGQNFRLRGS